MLRHLVHAARLAVSVPRTFIDLDRAETLVSLNGAHRYAKAATGDVVSVTSKHSTRWTLYLLQVAAPVPDVRAQIDLTLSKIRWTGSPRAVRQALGVAVHHTYLASGRELDEAATAPLPPNSELWDLLLSDTPS